MDARAWSFDESLPSRPTVGDAFARDRQWFFGQENRPAGPVDEGQLCEMVARGELPASTQVWADGMRHWVPASRVVELCPNCPGAVGAATLGAWSSLVRPGRRALARAIDSVCPVVCAVLAGMLLVAGDGVTEVVSIVLSALVGLLFGGVLEAFSLARIGSTPGKSLMSLRVRTGRGALPSLRTALERSLMVWVYGLACGFVPLMPVTLARARAALCRRGQTSWDLATGLFVEERPVRTMRVALSLAAFGAVSVLLVLLLRGPRG